MNMRRVTGPSECPPETHSCAGSLDAGSPTGFRSGAFGGPGRQDADGGDLPSPEQYDFPPDERSRTPFVDTGVGREASRLGPWEASSNREEFVSNEANSDSGRNLGVEEEGSHGLKDILSQFVPRISLSHDRLGQTLGNVAFVPVLRDLEYDLSVHVLSISPRSAPC